jgi:hypothetical protein
MFSSSFLNSFSGEIPPIDDPFSSAVMDNNVLFDLDFGEPAGLGEEMERDLAEAWNIKIDRYEQPASNNFTASYELIFSNIQHANFIPNFSPPDIVFGDVIDVFDEPFNPDVAFNIIPPQEDIAINDLGMSDNEVYLISFSARS